MINKYKEMVEKLVCISMPSNVIKGDCKNCKYRLLEEVNNKIPCPADVEIDGKKYWESCNSDKVCLDAARLLQEIANEHE